MSNPPNDELREQIREELLRLTVNGGYVITEFGGSWKLKALVDYIATHYTPNTEMERRCVEIDTKARLEVLKEAQYEVARIESNRKPAHSVALDMLNAIGHYESELSRPSTPRQDNEGEEL